jgi:ABC-type branched-subunit amino acid transport system substrate-binding protein
MISGTPVIGIALPSSGIDGGEGIRMRDAVLVAAGDTQVEVRPLTGAQAVQNPHQDEGSDNGADVAAIASSIASAARERIRVVIGPLRSNVASAADSELRRRNVVAISGSAGEPSLPGSHVFKLAPSDAQVASAAYHAIRRRFGSHVCVLDDGTSVARTQTAAFARVDPSARRLSVGPSTPERAANPCVRGANAIFAAGLSASPVFCSAATAQRAGAIRLTNALSLRSFDPGAFASAGALFRAEPQPIGRTKEIQDIDRRYHARAFVAADDEALRYYAAVQIAARAQRTAHGTPLIRLLRVTTFTTAIGAVRFNANGDIANPKIVIKKIN